MDSYVTGITKFGCEWSTNRGNMGQIGKTPGLRRGNREFTCESDGCTRKVHRRQRCKVCGLLVCGICAHVTVCKRMVVNEHLTDLETVDETQQKLA